MIAESVSLGVLSLASAAAQIGLVSMAGVIAFFSAATYFGGMVLYQFRRNHPEIRSYGDIGEYLCGRPGRLFFEGQVFILLIFIMAGHVSIFSTMCNQLAKASGSQWRCTVFYKVLAALISALCNMLRKFKSSRVASICCGFSSKIASTMTAHC